VVARAADAKVTRRGQFRRHEIVISAGCAARTLNEAVDTSRTSGNALCESSAVICRERRIAAGKREEAERLLPLGPF